MSVAVTLTPATEGSTLEGPVEGRARGPQGPPMGVFGVRICGSISRITLYIMNLIEICTT